MLNETLSEDEKINSKKSDNNSSDSYSFNQNSLTQKQFLNVDSYKCDICLGTYSTKSSLIDISANILNAANHKKFLKLSMSLFKFSIS